MGRGAWRATAHAVAEPGTTECVRAYTHTHTHTHTHTSMQFEYFCYLPFANGERGFLRI